MSNKPRNVNRLNFKEKHDLYSFMNEQKNTLSSLTINEALNYVHEQLISKKYTANHLKSMAKEVGIKFQHSKTQTPYTHLEKRIAALEEIVLNQQAVILHLHDQYCSILREIGDEDILKTFRRKCSPFMENLKQLEILRPKESS